MNTFIARRIDKGSLSPPKWMNFRKISEGGGGGHFRSKKFHCNLFCIRNGNFGHEFPEKLQKGGGVISDLKNFIANLVPAQPVCGKNRNEIFRKRGGEAGGSKAVRKFSGNSSILVETGFP